MFLTQLQMAQLGVAISLRHKQATESNQIAAEQSQTLQRIEEQNRKTLASLKNHMLALEEVCEQTTREKLRAVEEQAERARVARLAACVRTIAAE